MTEELDKGFKHPLKKFFTTAADHLVAMAKCHADAMEKCEDENAATFHKAAMAEYTDFAAKCAECAKDVGIMASRKAAGLSDDLDALMPSAISAIAPEAPRQFLRAVPRFGQREMPQPTDSTISKILGVDGEA